MPPIIVVGLLISVIYLLFNDSDDESTARKAQSGETNETVLAHDVSNRRSVHGARLVRKRKSNDTKSNRTSVKNGERVEVHHHHYHQENKPVEEVKEAKANE